VVIAALFTSIGTWSLMGNLRTLSMEEVATTIWSLDGPLFYLWAFAVPLGSVLAGIAALVYAKSKPVFAWLAGIGVLGAVLVMNLIWSRVYQPVLFGIGGTIILLSFFAIVWLWMKRYSSQDSRERTAGSYKLIGYLFWINASWFLCGETGKLHLRAFEGDPLPSPIEIMVFLVLGWIFVLFGEYRSRQLGSA
jgi:O-antigen ligase